MSNWDLKKVIERWMARDADGVEREIAKLPLSEDEKNLLRFMYRPE
jgi:hypothetical protein